MAINYCDSKTEEELSWHLVGDVEILKSKQCRKIFMKEGPLLALFCVAPDRFFLTDTSCPHAGGPLDQGDIEDIDGSVRVVCPLHDYSFDLVTGKSPSGLVLTTYQTEIRDQQVYALTPRSISLTKFEDMKVIKLC
uniref:Rieske domain-containing protein n=1 Tax=Arion vulgaris TaxID=1028688 RepID=A0A0B6Z049_9EUPU